MNNTRRKQIQVIIDKLLAIREDLDLIRDEEQEAFDNTPENLYGSERYERAEEAVDNLDEAYDAFDDIIDYLEEAQN